jgi:hypothetical protein
MPRISDFYGIAIYMYYTDHPPPHFHAIYAQYDASVNINTLEILDGKLPKRVNSLVVEWASKYQTELQHNWQLARDKEALQRIPPLD